jgi:hypothetical protein
MMWLMTSLLNNLLMWGFLGLLLLWTFMLFSPFKVGQLVIICDALLFPLW